MKRILKELIALVIVLGVAVGLMFAFAVNVESKPAFTQLSGRVVALPINISSPVYGQITSLSVMAGDTVHQGETLATVQMLDPRHADMPHDSSLYRTISDNKLAIESPVNGVVGSVLAASESTIGVANTLVTVYTPNSLQLHVLIPQGTSPTQFSAFYATDHVGGTRYTIKLLSQVPNTATDPTLGTYAIYAAQFTSAQGAQALLPYHSVVVLAQQPAQSNRHLPLPSLRLPIGG